MTLNSQLIRKNLKDDNWFYGKNANHLYSFAVAVHLNKYPNGDIADIGDLDNDTGMASGTFDPNGHLENLVKIFRPEAEYVNDTLQNWINSGLEIMYERYNESGRFDLNDYFIEL